MDEKIGKVTVAPEVLTTVVRQTVLAQPGVVRLSTRKPDSVGRLLGRVAVSEGLRIDIGPESVAVEIFLVTRGDVNLLHLGQMLQSEVARAISHMVSMDVSAVNVRIEDVVFARNPA